MHTQGLTMMRMIHVSSSEAYAFKLCEELGQLKSELVGL